MKTKIVSFIFIIFCNFFAQAQTIFNTEDKELMLLSVSTDSSLIIPAHQSCKVEAVDTIYYAFLKEKEADYQTVKKIGFCRLVLSDSGVYVFSVKNKLPIFVINNSSESVSFEFNDLIVTLPPNSSYQANDLVLELGFYALAYLNFEHSLQPGLSLLSFQIKDNKLVANLRP